MVARMDSRAAAAERGCWIEGSRGWTGSARLVELAQMWGMPPDEDDRSILSAYLASQERLILSTGADVNVACCVVGKGELADKAEQWLNDNIAPEGWSFAWCDGEFFLWPDSEWMKY